MPVTPTPEALQIARFKTLSGPAAQRVQIDVHFNPESLQYTVQNTLREEGRGARRKQHVSQTTAKLTMQLVFDTTHSGEDVRIDTDKMAKLLQPYSDGSNKSPPLVEFGWGVYRFTGLVEQYKETIDFFAAGGVPLRSSVDITLASQDAVFDSTHNPSAGVDSDMSNQEPTVHRQPGPDQSTGPSGASGLASALGDPRAARAIAALNGSASLRFGAGASLAVGGGVKLQAPAAFSVGASAGGGAGFGAGIGIGASAGIGIGAAAGASTGIGGSAGIGIGAGAGVSAGASGGASSGAFSGLRAATSNSLSVPNGRSLFSAKANAGTGSNSQFAAGGRAQAQGGTSLSVDVGAQADLSTRIKFN
jgi:hypothetical protein